MKESRSIVVSGLVLVGAKLVLLSFQAAVPTSALSDLSDCGLVLFLAVATWRASRRSDGFTRALWLSIVFFSVLEAVSFGIGTLANVLREPARALDVFWPTTIIFYLISVGLILPLLLKDDGGTPFIGWLQVLDLAQLGILTLSNYLVFFYIPSISGHSDEFRARNFMFLHLMRNGFLVLGFTYRGWRCRYPDLRRLQFRFAAFFLAFGATASLYLRALSVWRWPQPLVGFVADLPVLFLLVTAVSWRPSREPLRPAPVLERRQGRLWNLVFPLIIPFSVIVLASRISTVRPWVAWTAITLSFACYAGRLLVMQSHQNATLSRLAATEEKFSLAFKSSPAAITISRFSDGRLIDVNDRCLQLMNWTREEAIGKTSLELGIFENAADRVKLVEALRKNGSVRGMSLNFRTGGRILNTLVSAEVVEIESEPLIIASILDMTEFRSVIQQLHHAQKMELVGALAGGVAHDFNNLLTVIIGYSALAMTRQLDSELAEEIAQIREAASRAATLTQQLLAVSRRQVLQPSNVSLNTVLLPIEKLLRRTLGANIELVTSLDPELGTVYADPAQVEQVVINLAVNARDAMPNGGRLLFETKNLELSSAYPERNFEVPAGRYVMLAVTDTGTGIQPEHLERIFEPFFTTKEAGSGTGLGLSTVYGIVKQSGGHVWVYSDVGVGTTFKICLPRVDSAADAMRAAESGPDDLRGKETVLVVDDDCRVCELTAKVLSQYGYHVITANSGQDALCRAGEFDGEIHLLVTDVVMAKTSGKELAQRLRATRPRLKVLYMSGYTHLALADDSALDFRATAIPKPFAPSDLARQARKALNSLP